VVTTLLQQQEDAAELKFQIQMAEIRSVVDERYKATKADIKAIQTHLKQTTGFSPPEIIYEGTDDAKKGEIKKAAKKGEKPTFRANEGLVINDKSSRAAMVIPRPDGSKRIDDTWVFTAKELENVKIKIHFISTVIYCSLIYFIKRIIQVLITYLIVLCSSEHVFISTFVTFSK